MSEAVTNLTGGKNCTETSERRIQGMRTGKMDRFRKEYLGRGIVTDMLPLSRTLKNETYWGVLLCPGKVR